MDLFLFAKGQSVWFTSVTRRSRMRLITQEYDTGEKYSVKTTTDGLHITETFRGQYLKGVRTEIVINAKCRDTTLSMHKLLDNLKWTIYQLENEIVKNQSAAVSADGT